MKLGEYQELYYKKKVDFGVYLAETMTDDEQVLLPMKQVPENARMGEKIRVFLYKDSRDRLIATTNDPKLTLGGYAPLVVREVGKIGAFLDWGLEKDLFLPYKEMVGTRGPRRLEISLPQCIRQRYDTPHRRHQEV